MQSKSIKGKTINELKTSLDEVITDKFQPTLAVVFCSISQPIKDICAILDKKNISIFGCTTNGEFIDEETEKESWTLLLLDLNRQYFDISIKEYPDKNYREVAKDLTTNAKKLFDDPVFLIALSDVYIDAEEALRGIQEIAGEDIDVFGGLSGDDFKFEENLVFTNKITSNKGLMMLSIDGAKMEVKGIATCGWKAIGTEKTVTKSEGNHVYTIDGIPALDITAKYGGLKNVSPDNKDLFVDLACNLPIQLQRPEGDPIMRGGLVIDWDDHSFYTTGTVPQGSKVKFSVPPDWDVVDKVVKSVKQLKDSTLPEAEALIVFSCAGRLLSLGPLINEEIEGIKNVYNVPMIGMFSNGELGRATGGNLEMLNLTSVTVALKEK